MNTSQNTQLLSAEQLDGFLQNKLPAEEMKRVQHLLDDCELSREALEGYTLVPGAFADVEGLKKTLAKKSGMSSLNWAGIGLSVVGLAVIAALITMIYSEDPKPIAEQPQTPENYTLNIPMKEDVLSPSDDHFVNPEANVVQLEILPQNFAGGGDTIDRSNYATVTLQPIPTDEALQPIVESVPVTPKVVEKTYNAQVGFIVDLKVTEFDKYYTTQTIEVKELKLGGTPAEFETPDGAAKDENDKETVRSVPADQFLREGLLAFRSGSYGRCVTKMDVLLDHNPDDINALFYTAVSYVKLEMYSKAIPLLDKIIVAENNVFDEEAEWYKALALEGNGDTAAANELFKKIADAGGFYSKQASAKLK